MCIDIIKRTIVIYIKSKNEQDYKGDILLWGIENKNPLCVINWKILYE